MAGLFLLMIGSSALFLRGRSGHAPSSMQVSEQGEPVASVMTETVDRPPADKGGIAAEKAPAAPSPLATAVPVAAASAAGAPGGSLDALGGLASRAAPRGRAGDDLRSKDSRDMEMAGGSVGGGAGGAPASPPPAAHYSSGNTYSTPATVPAAPPPPPANAPAPQFAQAPMKSASDGAQAQQAVSDFDDAMNAYNAGDYATATQRFDVVAKRGDLNAALWEARSVHRANGAATAAPMFDRVAQQAGASAVGYDAMFDAARCYRELGQLDAARQRLSQLLLVPSYINRAQAELSAMNPKAAAKARPAQPPQAAPAAPASSTGAY
jgi:TolA-binding protein